MKIGLILAFTAFVLLASGQPNYQNSITSSIIDVEIRGEGHPMILLHGMFCSGELWNDVVGYYENRYEMHIVTVAGFGNNREMDAPHALPAIRNAIIAYVKGQNLHQPILMGHSMGGFMSLMLSIEAPDLFGKVINVDGLPYFPKITNPEITPETAGQYAKQMQTWLLGLDTVQLRGYHQESVSYAISNASKREKALEMAMNSNLNVVVKVAGEMYTTDIRDKLDKIKQPVLFLGSWYGGKMYGVTKESSMENYKEQVKKIPDVRVEIAETALHFIFYDQPDWFFAMVDGFLSEE